MRPNTPLQWVAVALVLLAASSPQIARVLAGERGATVNVRWRPSVTESERRHAEAQFRLADGQPLGEDTWRYDLIDPSRGNIRALLIDPAVADTHNIDRSNGVLDPSAPRTSRRQRHPVYGERLVAIADRLPIAVVAIVALVGLGRRASRKPAAKAWWLRVRWMFRPPGHARLANSADSQEGRPRRWTAVVLAVLAPLAAMLCLTLWRTPFPITEAVALFEDAAARPPTRFLIPDTTYYRPLFQMLLSVFWHSGWSLDTTLMWIRLLTIVPALLLVILFIWHCRPRSAPEAVAAFVAVAVLIGSPGFRDNLELPLSYTIVGMAVALMVWVLLNREPRIWHVPVVVALTLTAIGFKEQGLALVPLVVAAWWTRAPGASRGLAGAHAAIALAYVALRLIYRGTWPVFAQDIGLGFTAFDASEAAARFGDFPYWIYAYNAAATMSNVLFSEPTRGVFRVVRALLEGRAEPWEINHLVSSIALTGVILWWGIGSIGRAAQGRWSSESRVFIALGVSLLASGLLSFNYSRDRLGGMATVFYALAAFLALRTVATRVWKASGPRLVMASVALTLLAAAWQTRAIATVEHTRIMAQVNRTQWLVMLPERRMEFAQRPIYLHIMQTMIDQGVDPAAPRATPYPRWFSRALGPE